MLEVDARITYVRYHGVDPHDRAWRFRDDDSTAGCVTAEPMAATIATLFPSAIRRPRWMPIVGNYAAAVDRAGLDWMISIDALEPEISVDKQPVTGQRGAAI